MPASAHQSIPTITLDANEVAPSLRPQSAVSRPLSVRDARSRDHVRVLSLSTAAFTLMFAVWLMFAVIGIPIQKEFALSDVQFFWLGAIAILNGAVWRLAFGIITDRYGGRMVMTALLLATAIPTVLVTMADSFAMLAVCAFFIGIAGNSFSVGIAWNSAWFPKQQQGMALGTFGAGSVGASLNKMLGPFLIGLAMTGFARGFIPGNWRILPLLYAVLLLLMAACVWWMSPRENRCPGRGKPLRESLRPLRQMRVWRFGLYYVAVFGAYVAFSLVLPKYFMHVYGLSLTTAGLLSSLFVFPSTLLCPFGGWLADRFGPRVVMYCVFTALLAVSAVLALPDGCLGFIINVWEFTALICCIGVGMGIGKATVFRFVVEWYPNNVSPIGGLVGMLGALGGFLLPLMFGYTKEWTGLEHAPFLVLFVLIATCFIWLHVVVVGMRRSGETATGVSGAL